MKRIALSLLAALILVGCGKSDLEDAWQRVDSSDEENGMVIKELLILEFESDQVTMSKTCTAELNEEEVDSVDVKATSEIEVDGENIKIGEDDNAKENLEVPGRDAHVCKVELEKGTEISFSIKDDVLTIKDGEESTTFTRVKE